MESDKIFVVAALYKFVQLPDYTEIQPKLQDECQRLNIKGTILLAQEGINGTIAGSRDSIDAIRKYLESDSRFWNLEYKESFATREPFLRMKVRLKKEIVTMGVPQTDPNSKVGQYLSPEEWNKVISDPEVILIDTRNDYEVDIGTFKNAVDPCTKTFREFPKYVKENLDPKRNKKVAMFCTGGIRCEKASSYMLDQGFETVYHLKGGILKYLEEVPAEKSLWDGECFVFDQRVAVGHGLKEGSYDQCYGCRHPVTEEEKLSSEYVAGVHCPHCINERTEDQHNRARQRHHQVQIAKKLRQKHIGS